MSYTQSVDEINELLGYDADISDPSQRCKHGTFIGSSWGPDYLCHQCEMGYNTLTPITFNRIGIIFIEADGDVRRSDGERKDYTPPRFLRSAVNEFHEDFKDVVAKAGGEVKVAAYRRENGQRELSILMHMPDGRQWGEVVQIGRRSVWTA